MMMMMKTIRTKKKKNNKEKFNMFVDYFVSFTVDLEFNKTKKKKCYNQKNNFYFIK